MRVPPPIPVHASRGSDSICLLHSPPGKLHMESHTGPKYKLPPSLRLGFPSLAGGLTPPFRPIAEGSTPCSGTSALAVLCPGSSPCPPTPCCRAAAPGERPESFRSDGEAAVGPQTFALSPGSLEELLELTANCIKYEGEGKGGDCRLGEGKVLS